MIGELLEQFQARTPLAPLLPTQIWRPELSSQISQSSNAELFGNEANENQQREMRLAIRAGLFLLNDDLKASHDLSQQIETPTGSFWHAIMHRREGDFSNSNYWWRKTGNHMAFADVWGEIFKTVKSGGDNDAIMFLGEMEISGNWQPTWFVESCEKAAREKREPLWLQELQRAEMMGLLNWCRAQI